MPIEDLHRVKKKTNFAILAVLFAFCVLLFAITIVKINDQNTDAAGNTPSIIDDSTYVPAPIPFNTPQTPTP